ncbi:MAG TPA: hypothetical protein VIW95_10335 [Candidatus Binatus sp.]|uniref:hypothetical protein n=1 Tax=Candidatus Binatus sp. TaxID=2811406 RepID=UPI002F425D81
MSVQASAVKIAVVLAVTLAASAPAFAQDMKGMDMSGHEMPQMSGTKPSDPSNMKEGEMDSMSDEAMDHDTHMGGGALKNMSLHMAYTDLRPANDADKARAAVLVTDLQHSLAKYKDYHVAEADGFKPFHPEFKTPVVHFTRNWNGLKAAFTFDPNEPTSLLYQRTPEGGYKLIGAMYTDRKGATVDQLNERVPLSVARWHRHINFCIPARGTDMKTADWTKFGFNGSIATKEACDAAGGRFFPQVFGWMVHVYPWETNPQLVWAH